jgi:hypothetical protein
VKPPVLIGGTGRSGSTIVGHLLDHHRSLVLSRPMEVRFITGNNGIADALAAARRSPNSSKASEAAALAADRIVNRWYRRAPDVGLHTSVTSAEINAWTAQYLRDFDADPLAATRAITDVILQAIASNLGAEQLVDTTPANARKADRVEQIYPESKVIIVLRDGRDVAASFVSQSFGPNDVFEALDQWEQRMLRSHRAANASRPDRILQIELADLVERDRSGTLEAILTFLDLPDDAGMRTWFDENVRLEHAHGGRWRTQFDAQTTERIDAQYAAICDRLTQEGVRLPT